MNLIRALYSVVIDALFPVSPEEAFLSRLAPEDAMNALPPAPPYDGTVVPMPGTRSVLAYKDKRVSRLVWCIKNKKDVHAAKIGGFVLAQKIESRGVEVVIIVPIPISKQRRRERGYNQCEVLMDAMQKYAPHFIYEKNLLVRAQHKAQQKKNSRDERLKSASGIFAADADRAREMLRRYSGKRIAVIVIDDVITTGSTLKSALDTLRDAGFTDVRGLSLAH